MINHSTFLDFLWGDGLKNVVYILDQVPNTFMSKTPYELLMGRKSGLKYFHVWG